MTSIRFGTDGWRAEIAEEFTFDNVRRCTQGFAKYLKDEGKGGGYVVVGHDRRFASRRFAGAAAEVLVGNGFRVWLTAGPTPTPGISYSAVERKAAGAINITASHNPASYNGFKVRDERGAAIAPQGLAAIEAAIPAIDDVVRVDLEEAEADERVRVWDPAPAYVEHVGGLIELERIRKAGLNVLIDPMWGNGIGWFPQLLEGGATQVSEMHNVPNPSFPGIGRPEPIPYPVLSGGMPVGRGRKRLQLHHDPDAVLDGVVHPLREHEGLSVLVVVDEEVVDTGEAACPQHPLRVRKDLMVLVKRESHASGVGSGIKDDLNLTHLASLHFQTWGECGS